MGMPLHEFEHRSDRERLAQAPEGVPVCTRVCTLMICLIYASPRDGFCICSSQYISCVLELQVCAPLTVLRAARAAGRSGRERGKSTSATPVAQVANSRTRLD